MNIDTILQQPTLLDTLTPEQKLSVYQQLQQKQQTLQQQKLKAQSQLELKQKEQQDLLLQLQQLTGKSDIQSIRNYIQQLQQQFDNDLQQLITEYSKLS